MKATNQNKVRVLVVCTVPTTKSGIPNVIFNLFEGMSNENIEFGYVSINEPPEEYKIRLKELGINLYIIERNIKNPFSYILKLCKVSKKYDILHAHGNSATLTLEMFSAKIAGIRKRIAHSHNTQCSMKIIDCILRPFFYMLCNERMACGKEAGKWLFGKRPFKIINNGINTSKFGFDIENRFLICKELNLSNKKIIGNIANFVEQKNHVFLIDIFAKIFEKDPSMHLLLIGDGPLITPIKLLVQNKGLENNVSFLGSIENPSKYYSAIDFIVMPSLFEGLPLTLIEAQANGLRAIVSETISRDVNITGNISFMPLNLSAKEWAEKILSAVEYKYDRVKASQEAINAIVLSGYEVGQNAKYLSSIYLNC